MNSTLEKRQAIGITTIWGEGDGVERVSFVAVLAHCVRQAIENVRRSSITPWLRYQLQYFS